MRRLVRVSVLGLVADRWRRRRRSDCRRAADADRLPARGGPGRVLRRGAAARGASVNRTSEAAQQVEELLQADAAGRRTCSRSSATRCSTASASRTRLRRRAAEAVRGPHAARPNSAQALIGRVFAAGQQVRAANVIPFNLPPIIGLSTSGGFEYQLEGPGRTRPRRRGSVMQGLVAAANQDPRLTRVFTTYTATTPSLYLDIDREKAQTLGLTSATSSPRCRRRSAATTSTTSTCSAAPGRSTSRPRRRTAAISRRSTGSTSATERRRWCRCARSPSRASISGRRSSSATTTTARSRSTAARARARRRATALAAMDGVSAKTLPPATASNGPAPPTRRRRRPARPTSILALAVLFAYLFLVGAVRELDDPGAGAAVGDGRRARRVRRRS